VKITFFLNLWLFEMNNYDEPPKPQLRFEGSDGGGGLEGEE
jgi:hypothetical protein